MSSVKWFLATMFHLPAIFSHNEKFDDQTLQNNPAVHQMLALINT